MCVGMLKVATKEELRAALPKLKPNNMAVIYSIKNSQIGGCKGFRFPEEVEEITQFVKNKLENAHDYDVFLRQSDNLMK